jgi:DNA-binding transcriptional ArsR family regulator
MGDPYLSAEAATDLAEVMQGLASPTRLQVVARLRQGALDVTSLSHELDISQATLSNHLRVLRHAHLVKGTRLGRSIVYSLFDDHVAAFIDEALTHLRHTR